MIFSIEPFYNPPRDISFEFISRKIGFGVYTQSSILLESEIDLEMNPFIFWENIFEGWGRLESDAAAPLNPFKRTATKESILFVENFSSAAPIFKNFKLTRQQIEKFTIRLNETFRMIVPSPPPVVPVSKSFVVGDYDEGGGDDSRLKEKIGYVFKYAENEEDEENEEEEVEVSLVPLSHVQELSSFFEKMFVDPLKIEWLKHQYKKLRPKN